MMIAATTERSLEAPAWRITSATSTSGMSSRAIAIPLAAIGDPLRFALDEPHVRLEHVRAVQGVRAASPRPSPPPPRPASRSTPGRAGVAAVASEPGRDRQRHRHRDRRPPRARARCRPLPRAARRAPPASRSPPHVVLLSDVGDVADVQQLGALTLRLRKRRNVYR